MSVLSTFSEQDMNTQQNQWEKSLKTELKLAELGSKAVKSSIDGGKWTTLSLSSPQNTHFPVTQNWKKAAQTYIEIDSSNIEHELMDDLSHGVRNFFFQKEFLTQELWKKISGIFSTFDKLSELEVFLLGSGSFEIDSNPYRLIDETNIVSGRPMHDGGGSNFQELGLLACELIEKMPKIGSTVYLGVFTDSQFFRNIAKIRAAKLLTMKILEESGLKKNITVVALTSYREWTLYERYSNMLRNDAAVASAYIGGADHVQSAGYNAVFELEGVNVFGHSERSRRMGRNTSHILSLESMLGVVQDAAFGSYHLESLTQHYAQEAWKEMQQLLALTPEKRSVRIKNESMKVAESRLELVKTRKHVMAGMNDFPDAEEVLNLPQQPQSKSFRVARGFESLRLKMEKLKTRPEVYIGIFGEYASLNGRVNFVKNYFQLLGLKVREVMNREELTKKEGIVVLCASDADYAKLDCLELKASDKFIAGKFEMQGFQNLFAGQDVYKMLEAIVGRWGNK